MDEKEIKTQSCNNVIDKDWLLQSFVDVVNNNSGSTIGITLTTHGFLISGDLIGGKEYFDELGRLLGNISEAKVHDHYKKMGEEIYSEENQKNESGPSLLHLKNAKFYNATGESIPSNSGTLWRGKISEISGFTLGKLSAEK